MDQKVGEFEQKSLINELAQGKELAKRLQAHLNVPSSSQETREVLVDKILASYEKALSMLTLGNASATIGLSESPPSLSGSPGSEDSDPEHRHDASRKRKSMPRWTQQVKVSPGMGLEGPLDDGFSWRKYGQKDILGAKYPRGYYRCTHRYVQGCLATKQVQRSDEDPTIFEVTYRGRHTCAQSGSQLTGPQSQPSDQNQEPTTTANITDPPLPPPPQHNQELLLNFRTGLKVITTQPQQDLFKFPSTSNVNHDYQNGVFSPSVVDSGFMGNFSPPFGSPSASGAPYFSASSSFGGNRNLIQSRDQSENNQVNETMPAATSATNSPMMGLEFPFGNMDFDPNFSFDNRGFLH